MGHNLYNNFCLFYCTGEYLDKFNLRLRRDNSNKSSSMEDDDDVDDGDDLTSEELREKRSLAVPLDKLQQDVKNLDYKLKYNFDLPRATIGWKMFGNDIQYNTIEGHQEFIQRLQKLNPWRQLEALFAGKELNYTKSGIFLDVSYDVPLCSGLPLSIHAFGASSIDFRLSGALRDHLVTKKDVKIDIEAKIKPSVSVDVIATMQSDYFYGTAGIRVKSNLYSSSSVDAKFKINGAKRASLQFSLPQDRNDIFSAKSEMLVLKYDKDITQAGIKKRYTNSTCTWPFIDRAVGLQICSNYSLPDVNNATTDYPSLLLSGPINLNIHLDKADATAKIFVFDYQWDTYGNSSSGAISFNTPGSKIPRIFNANITTDPEHYNLSMSFQNGALVQSAVGTFKNTPSTKKLEIYFNLDGTKNLVVEVKHVPRKTVQY